MILISIIRNLFGEHMLIYVLMSILLIITLHGFGPSAAFRFQVRVCADISCITNVALVQIAFFPLPSFNML